MSKAVPGLAVARVQSDADLEAMIAVRAAAKPDQPAPRLDNLRHNLASSDTLVYLVARLEGEPAACGFVDPWPEGYAEAHFVVAPRLWRRGVGSAMLAEFGRRALEAGRPELQGEVTESDAESREYLERRGYTVVGGEKAVALDLESLDPEPVQPPPGVEIVTLAERSELADALFPIAAEGVEDIPGNAGSPTLEQFRAIELERPSRRRELFFVALVDGEPVGYASVDEYGRDASNGLTAVRRAWRRRGVATALKRARRSPLSSRQGSPSSSPRARSATFR